MFGFERTKHAPKLMAAVAAAALPLSLAACDTEGSEQGADVEDVTEEQFFANDQFVGETVTVSAEIDEVLTPTSFQLDAQEWGDDSLLVVSANKKADLAEGDVVKVKGTVREFQFNQFENEFGLTDRGRYEPFDNEQFLVASNMNQNAQQPNPG